MEYRRSLHIVQDYIKVITQAVESHPNPVAMKRVDLRVSTMATRLRDAIRTFSQHPEYAEQFGWSPEGHDFLVQLVKARDLRVTIVNDKVVVGGAKQVAQYRRSLTEPTELESTISEVKLQSLADVVDSPDHKLIDAFATLVEYGYCDNVAFSDVEESEVKRIVRGRCEVNNLNGTIYLI